jgi:hypothetical protein
MAQRSRGFVGTSQNQIAWCRADERGALPRSSAQTSARRPSPPISSRDWEVAVGTRIAARTRPLRLERGVLQVIVSSAAWSQELSLLATSIAEQLRARGIKVDSLRFSVGKLEPDARPPRRPKKRAPRRRAAAPRGDRVAARRSRRRSARRHRTRRSQEPGLDPEGLRPEASGRRGASLGGLLRLAMRSRPSRRETRNFAVGPFCSAIGRDVLQVGWRASRGRSAPC